MPICILIENIKGSWKEPHHQSYKNNIHCDVQHPLNTMGFKDQNILYMGQE